MNPETNRAIVTALTEEIWNQARLDRIPHYYAPEYVADYRPYAPLRHGHDSIRGMIQRAHAAWSNYHEQLHTLVAEADRVVAHFTISGIQTGPWGTLAPTNKPASFDEIVILTLREGRVIHQRGVVDNLGALRQLGVIPAPKQQD